jgi:hypothetical protein
MVAELSWKFQVAAPLTRSSVPLGWTGENVFVTHTERPAFEIGSGVPNLQPMSVQSTPVGVEPDVVDPSVQLDPAQDSVKRLVAPGGVELSGTCEMPPPIERPPQSRFFSGIVPARSRKVLPHVPVAEVERKSKPDGAPPPVVEVVDDVGVAVVLLLDDVLLEVEDVVAGRLVDVDVVGPADEDVVGAAEDVVGPADEDDVVDEDVVVVLAGVQ